jgi:hypothetical protein
MHLLRRLAAIPMLCLLAACAAPPATPPATPPGSIDAAAEGLPPMQRFGPTRAAPPSRSNADMARDFLDLGFLMESGRALPRLTRFEGPVGISVQPGAPATLGRDLDDLLVRLRREAGIDIRRLPDGSPTQIVVATPSRAQLKAQVPEAACFVVPNVGTWEEFLRQRSSRATDWTQVERRASGSPCSSRAMSARRRCAIACTKRSRRRSARSTDLFPAARFGVQRRQHAHRP